MSALQGKKSFPAPILENIPDELKAPEVRRWVVWKLTEGKDKDGNPVWKKLLYQAKNGYLAKPNGPKTWASFDQAVKAYTDKITITYTEKGKAPVKLVGGPDGIGFVFGFEESTGKNYFGVDLDGLTTPEKWSWALQIVKDFGTYAEKSPSLEGLHIIGIGTKGPGQTGTNCRKKGVEVYDQRHYFTFTGNQIEGTPKTLNEREEQFRAFHASIWSPKNNHKEKRRRNDEERAERLGSPKGEPPLSLSPLVALTDEEIKEKLLSEKGGDKARDLYLFGLFQKYYPDDSEDGGDWSGADMGLMNKIEFYCVNPSDEENAQQLDRVFSDSKLAKLDASSGRNKWTPGDLKSNPYRQATIAKAIAFGKEPDADHWSPHSKSGKGKGSKEGKKSLDAVVAETILEKYTLRTIKESGTILILEPGGGWREFDEREIGALTQEIAGRDYTSNKVVAEVIGKIKRENIISMEDFERRPELFMDANGKIFNALTCQFEDITDKDVMVYHKIGAVFDPSAPVPLDFIEAVERIYPNEEERLSFQEHFGSGFYREMFYDKAFVTVGDTRNGKTTIIQIVEAVAGKENCSWVPIQDMAKTFRPFKLWRKLFNFGDDISSEAMRNTANFKAQAGGGRMTIEQKHKDDFDANIYAKSFYGANLLPVAKEKFDDGYYSKFLLVKAPNTFLLPNEIGKDGLQEGEYAADPDLVKRLTSDPRKRSGILNYALEGLRRAKQNGGYSLKMTLAEGRARYDALSAPTSALEDFMKEICIKWDTGTDIRKADIKTLYETYLKARGLLGLTSHLTTTEYNKQLRMIGYSPEYRKPGYSVHPILNMADAEAKSPYLLKGLMLQSNWRDTLTMWEAIIKDTVNQA